MTRSDVKLADTDNQIRLRGVRVHNLQHVDLDLPRQELIVFCGLSGSGKTSLALDTLYAEGQRKYIESFSPYTRQFLEQLDKPDADSVDGVPPAVAVTHRNPSRSSRATVATVTEASEYLGMLFARAGEVFCDQCGKLVRQESAETVTEQLTALATGSRFMVGYPVRVPEEREAETPEIRDWKETLVAAGYVRAVNGESMIDLSTIDNDALAPGSTITVVVDRLKGGTDRQRIQDSLETAIEAGNGNIVIFCAPESDNRMTPQSVPLGQQHRIDGTTWIRSEFSNRLHCEACDRSFIPPSPALLNFNNPQGACHECEGFGNIIRIDRDRVVPDRSKSLREGAIAPWNTPAYRHELDELVALADDYQLNVDIPYDELSPRELELIDCGVPEREFGGLNGYFAWLEKRKYKMHIRAFLSRWKSHYRCPTCEGRRFRAEALAVKIDGHNAADLMQMTSSNLRQTMVDLTLSDWQQKVAAPLLEELGNRLGYLERVGVGYLTLDRPLKTLSGGEAQRVALTTTLGSNLVDMLYVLDEPSVGLHPRDVAALATEIEAMRNRGNTVVVVEHEPDIIRRGDQVVEVGPGAGAQGGKIVFQGTPQSLLQSSESNTGDWLAGRRGLGLGANPRTANQGVLSLRGARGNNLQNVDVDFPLGTLCAVSGVSGAGKSSLVNETLYPILARALAADGSTGGIPTPLPYETIAGTSQVDEVMLIDGTPLTRSARSNPVTYVKAFDPIRHLFAEQPEASARGFTAGHFSFNVAGGRCETCQGEGSLRVDMQFMADIFVTCPDCQGLRYQQGVLSVRYRQRNISDVLQMTVREAFQFFRGHKKVLSRLKALIDVGLDYVRLGQAASTLSSGEAQRLKLATFLAARSKAKTLFILDEPTVGLHFDDILKLLDCFDALVEVGHSLLVVEHNLQLLLASDWIIDLGPGAAHSGGNVVVAGPPREVAKSSDSMTGQFLAEELRSREGD